jgi:ribosomal peptide maturation radical SAM protein 1
MSGTAKILLVCPPFQRCDMSSLSTAHLATYLRAHGIPCAEYYPHIELAVTLGSEVYQGAAREGRSHGELLFAEGLHDLAEDASITRGLSGFGNRRQRDELRSEFVRKSVERIVRTDATHVGFTTSFNQLMASLFLARGVKQADARRTIVFGGAACTEPMGSRILQAYPGIVDHVVSGFGETSLLRIGRGEAPESALVLGDQGIELESMPIPEYEQFLAALSAVGWTEPVALTFETSRGCWWGQKHHCRFCGVNGKTLQFRTKSPQRAIDEIRTLWDRYHRNLFATDAIMPVGYADEVMPKLAEFHSGPKLFYELKSPMRQDQIAALARARVQGQPGLESLSTHLLQLLDKGGSAIRNIAFLKWSRERGLALGWNQLFAIPGERVADYDDQIELMKWIVHLPPPTGAFPIRIARFSPYFEDYRSYGWTRVEPLPEYRSWHPHLDAGALAETAAFFSGEGGPDPGPYAARFRTAIEQWGEQNERGDGLFLDPQAGLVRNQNGSGYQFARQPVLDAVIAATHDVTSVARVIEQTRCGMGVLRQMQQLGLVFIEQERVINLAVRTQLDSAEQATLDD